MAQSTTPRFCALFHRLRNPGTVPPELGVEEILPRATVEQVLKEEGGGWRPKLYTPYVTFWAFFWQRLSAIAAGGAEAAVRLDGRALVRSSTPPTPVPTARLGPGCRNRPFIA